MIPRKLPIPCEVCGEPMEFRLCERHVCHDCRTAYFERLFMRANERAIDWGIARNDEPAI